MATEPPSTLVCCDAKVQLKPDADQSWNNTSVSLGNYAKIFSEPLRAYSISTEECMGLPTDCKKKMQQMKLNSYHLVQVEMPDRSLWPQCPQDEAYPDRLSE